MGREADPVSTHAINYNLIKLPPNNYDQLPRLSKNTVSEYALYNDEVLLYLTTQLLYLSNEIKMHNVVSTFTDFI